MMDIPYDWIFKRQSLSGYDGMQIYITGNENRIQLSSVFDNLGKGASGAAIQCFNIMTGCDETK